MVSSVSSYGSVVIYTATHFLRAYFKGVDKMLDDLIDLAFRLSLLAALSSIAVAGFAISYAILKGV